MGRLVALACLGLLLVALAGCSGTGKDDDVATSSSSSTTTSSSSSSSPTKAPNQPPTGSISVVVNGTTAAFNLTGTDPDGDALAWNVTFGDGNSTNGTALPANVTHVFAAAGNFTANMTLSDGEATKTYNVTFSVAAAGTGATGAQDAVVEYAVGQGFCGGTYPEGAGGVVYGELAIDSATYGATFVATWEFVSPGSLGVQVVFKDASGTTVADIANVLVTELTDVVPDGAATAWFSDCGAGGPATVTYHAG